MPVDPDQRDVDLIDGLRRRDEAAFTTLVERYHAALVRLARVFVRDHAIAEEVAQETWLAVLQGIDRYEARGTLKSWLFRILSNRAKSRGVREGRNVNFSAIVGEEGPVMDPAQFLDDGHWRDAPRRWSGQLAQRTPEKLVLEAELGARIRAAIDELPERQRAVVLLRDVDGLDSEEACAILEVSEANQRVLLHRGRVAVRDALEAYLSPESPSDPGADDR